MTSAVSTPLINDTGIQKVQVRFCAVFDNMADELYIVNFDQLIITMNITLDGRFDVLDLEVQKREITLDEDQDITYEFKAQLCPGQEAVAYLGDLVDVCICTTGFPAVQITGVKSMVYEAGEVRQVSVNEEGLAEFLTAISEPQVVGSEASCMQVSTMPAGDFYSSNVGLTVSVSGVALLEFRPASTNSTRRLLTVTVEEEPFRLYLYLVSNGSGAYRVVASRSLPVLVGLAAAARMAM